MGNAASSCTARTKWGDNPEDSLSIAVSGTDLTDSINLCEMLKLGIICLRCRDCNTDQPCPMDGIVCETCTRRSLVLGAGNAVSNTRTVNEGNFETVTSVNLFCNHRHMP